MLLTRCFPPLALLRELERYFGCEVTAATFFESEDTGSQTPPGWAKGDYIVLPKGMLSPLRAEGIFFIAHEVCHLRQQAENVSMTRRQAETDADFHATVFTWQYLNGRRCTPAPKLLPLADAAAVPAAAWGLGGLFSLKQLITDGYAKHKGYAYFYYGPHEWLTAVAAHVNEPKVRNYVTSRPLMPDDYSLVLGSEMNDMYILPEIIKTKFSEDTLKAIGKAAEESDVSSVEDISFDDSAIKEAVTSLFDNNVSVLTSIGNIDISFIAWYTLFSNFLRASRYVALLGEVKSKIDEMISEELHLEALKEGVTAFKKDLLDVILKFFPEEGTLANILRISFFGVLSDFTILDWFAGGAIEQIFRGVVEWLAYDDCSKILFVKQLTGLFPKLKEKVEAKVNKEKREWYQERLREKTKNIKFVSKTEEDFICAVTLLGIWWVEDASFMPGIEGAISLGLRKGCVIAEKIVSEAKNAGLFLENLINEFLNNLKIEEPKEGDYYIPIAWLQVDCDWSKFYCDFSIQKGRITTSDIKQTAKDFIFKPILGILPKIVKEGLVPLLEAICEDIRGMLTYYTSLVFLLGSHTGELQFLHSMDCSRGSIEWNREKMIRWCELCYDCNKQTTGDSILNQNIYEYLNRLVPQLDYCGVLADSEKPKSSDGETPDSMLPKPMTPLDGAEPGTDNPDNPAEDAEQKNLSCQENEESGESDRQGPLFAEYAKQIHDSLPAYRQYYEKKEKDLLLAAMLLPLCCVKSQMTNCHLAARQVCGIELDDESKFSREQARDYDICLVLAMKFSLVEGIDSEEQSEPGFWDSLPSGKYRSPISDWTFRQFFTADRDWLSAPNIILGMTMHMIEDSFTPSHTVRTWNTAPWEGSAPIITFADYTKQDASRHACADYFTDAPGSISVEDIDELFRMNINYTDGQDCMDVDLADGEDMMDIDYQNCASKPKEQPEVNQTKVDMSKKETAEEMKRLLPFRALQTTVGAESALHFASEFFNYVQREKANLFAGFDRKKIEAIYPLVDDILDGFNRSGLSKEDRITDSDRETPASGRCYETEAIREETKHDSMAQTAPINSLTVDRDKRFVELQGSIEEYRKYLLKHLAPNLYPSQKGRSYYADNIAGKPGDISFNKRAEILKELISGETLEEVEKKYRTDFAKPGQLKSPTKAGEVLLMFRENDLLFLDDILQSPLLCKAAKISFEEMAETQGINAGNYIAEDIEETRNRYLRHVNELILNAAGIHEQTGDSETKKLAREVLMKAKQVKRNADSHWENGSGDPLENMVEAFLARVKGKTEKAKLFLRILAEGFDLPVIKKLLLRILRSDNPEEFRENAAILLDELEKMLEGNSSGKVLLDYITQLRHNCAWLKQQAGSFDPNTIRDEAELFVSELAEIIRKINIKDFPSIQAIPLPKGLRECLAFLREQFEEYFAEISKFTTADAGSATEGADTILADGVSLYESLLSKALDLAKGGKSTSDVAEEWLGEGVSMESVERMGRSFRNALKNA
ncbi:MAG: hypothetical protein J5795_05360 [Lachnospiraceae bacterium]|nr:hypothetical protein [Lachnospiraceae bacterium]MBO4767492.1 hypothetical protein [Lachnospiraceae bacterium]